ncbi:NAD-dependent epimerase [Natronogracilivirga saccharolytica]|uniref:NAD-dependent epimerase n=1 Tax=Natronogracilivirga saccharolytica TaxID=2812953 RepID=A0A8J7UUN8_9BACT|nr:NAD-dependent epimerase [Natronogracilivirga saccharolytica]MBP3193821.1 NAD-dependent epimerase [Natronogracilivirga saccharolytica]
MNVLVTGTAGFIGYHTVNKLLSSGYRVTGLDHLNTYYDVNLKYDRLRETGIDPESLNTGEVAASATNDNYRFVRMDLQDKEQIFNLFESEKFDVVINLAAQAGVRHSLTHPQEYIDYNITGFLNILEACRFHPVRHLIYASSSSVYGMNTRMPFSVRQNVDHPVSLYAATKKSNELMAHTYAHLFGVPSTGLRFFTVYGPWGRPDMALFLFTKAILEGKPIDIYNHGKMERDFTYVDDIVESISRLVPKEPSGSNTWSGDQPDPASSTAPYQLFNIGHNSPVSLMDFIREIERAIGKEAVKNYMDMQPGDVPKTWADVSDLYDYIDYSPQIGIREGISNFINWYRSYYRK